MYYKNYGLYIKKINVISNDIITTRSKVIANNKT